MIHCKLCQKEQKIIKVEDLGQMLMISCLPFGLLFGLPSLIFQFFLGVYLVTVHNSSKYICKSCYENSCLLCGKKLSSGRYCGNCKIIYCPFCKSHQSYDRSWSWFSSLILLPISLLWFVIAYINMWIGMLFLVAYMYFTAPQCKTCNEYLYASYHFIRSRNSE